MIQRSGRDDDDTIDGSKSSQQSTNDAKWRGGGAKGRRHDEGQGHTNNNQTDYAEGGLDGDDDDDNDDKDNTNDNGSGHDDVNDDGGGHDNDNDGGCVGRGGHCRMRMGREHDDRQKHNNQIDHRRGGEDGGDGSDNDNDNNNNDEATEQRRWRLVDGASASMTNSCTLVR